MEAHEIPEKRNFQDKTVIHRESPDANECLKLHQQGQSKDTQ